MHLAKTVQTIMACKEAIWDEYKHLQLAPELPPVVRTPKAFRTTQQASVREDFDSAWANWQKWVLFGNCFEKIPDTILLAI